MHVPYVASRDWVYTEASVRNSDYCACIAQLKFVNLSGTWRRPHWLLSWLLHKWRERLSVTNLSSENNLPMFWLNAPVVIRLKGWWLMTGAFSWNIGKLFSELKLVTDNLSLYLRPHWSKCCAYFDILPQNMWQAQTTTSYYVCFTEACMYVASHDWECSELVRRAPYFSHETS